MNTVPFDFHSKKENIDFSMAVIHIQILVCFILSIVVFVAIFLNGNLENQIKERCKIYVIGNFNFNEMIEHTIAMWLPIDSISKEKDVNLNELDSTVNQKIDKNKMQDIINDSVENVISSECMEVESISFDDVELDLPQTIYLPGKSPLESEFLDLGNNGQHILSEPADLKEELKGTSLSNYKVGIQGVLPTHGRISSNYGYREDPFTGERKFHGGLDIATPIGTPIAAVYGGKVIKSEYSDIGYGNHIVIQHIDGLITIYGHCSKLLVDTGTVVRAGEIIAEVGSSGNSTGPHLHFEARINGIKVSPCYLVDISSLKVKK